MTNTQYTREEKERLHNKVTDFITSFRAGDKERLITALKAEAEAEMARLLSESFVEADCLFLGAMNKVCALVDPFLFAWRSSNLTVCAILCRSIVDVAFTLFGMSCVEAPVQYAIGIGLKQKEVRDYRLSFGGLAKYLGELVSFDVGNLYKQLCRYDHCSSRAFMDAADASDGENDMTVSFFMGTSGKYPKKYAKLCDELAEQFFVFGMMVLKLFIPSWQAEKHRLAIP